MSGRLNNRDRWIVPLSLWVSYLANDGEELLTMARTMSATLEALPVSCPLLSSHSRLDQRHVSVAIASMGVLYAAAVIEGIRTSGRGWLYQDVQWVFGLHGVGHLAASAMTRRYTSGVLTSPTVVLPQLVFAISRLRRAGVRSTVRPARAAALVGGWLIASHALGAAVSSRQRG